jgi:hypothetical protein
MRRMQAWSGAAALGVAVLAVPSSYSTPTALASSSAHGVAAQVTPKAKTASLGNVRAGMPAAAISSTDGLPAALVANRSYRLTVYLGVAGGQPTTDAAVFLAGADRSACATAHLPSGAITALHCTFVPVDVGRLGLRVKVVVGAGPARQLVANFVHPVTGAASRK